MNTSFYRLLSLSTCILIGGLSDSRSEAKQDNIEMEIKKCLAFCSNGPEYHWQFGTSRGYTKAYDDCSKNCYVSHGQEIPDWLKNKWTPY